MHWQRLSGPAEPYTSLAFRADGQVLLAGAKAGGVRGWTTATGWPLPPVLPLRQRIWAVALAPAGQPVAASLDDGTVVLGPPGTTSPVRLPGPPSSPPFTGLAFAPDGQHLLGWHAAALRLWPLAAPTAGWIRPVGAGIADARWSPDGQWIATAGWDGPVQLWDAAEGTLRQSWACAGAGPSATPPALAFTPDGRWVAVGDRTGQVQCWPVPEGPARPAAPPLTGPICGLSFAAGGTLLAAGDATGRVRVWAVDAPHRATQGQLARGQRPHTLALPPDAGRLWVLTDDGWIYAWPLRPGRSLRPPQIWPSVALPGRITQAVFAADCVAVAILNGQGEVWLGRAPGPTAQRSPALTSGQHPDSP